ncbi:unnamed protein product, partial [Rotaria magnacalcarata]
SLYYQRNPHSTSYNGLTVDSNVTNASDNYYEQQNNNSNWLSPPGSDNFYLNRRASDSVAHLLLFQQQHSEIGSNTMLPVHLTNIASPVSSRSSRGSITRGSPIIPPIFTVAPHETNENDDDEDIEI